LLIKITLRVEDSHVSRSLLTHSFVLLHFGLKVIVYVADMLKI